MTSSRGPSIFLRPIPSPTCACRVTLRRLNTRYVVVCGCLAPVAVDGGTCPDCGKGAHADPRSPRLAERAT